MFRTCIVCDDIKELDKFVHRRSGSKIYYRNKCKDCYNKEILDKKRKKVLDEGGSTRVPENPNKYTDKIQKQQTFELMIACGWKFNEDNGIWYKEGIKDENGDFLILKKYKRDYMKGIKRRSKYTDLIPLMVEYHIEKKYNYSKIALKFNMNASTVRKLITKYLNLK